jgi:hypothetical protein
VAATSNRRLLRDSVLVGRTDWHLFDTDGHKRPDLIQKVSNEVANSSVSWVLPRKIRIIKSRKLFKFGYLLLVRMGFGSLTKVEQKKLLKLFGLFLALGLVLLFILPGSVKSGRLPIWTPWIILSMCAVGWFALELYVEKPAVLRLKRAFIVAIFLVVYDFAFENSGSLLGLWYSSHSLIPVCVPLASVYPACVPIEVMILTLFGGAAWALYIPQEFNPTYSILDILLIAVFGTLGEFVLIQYGLMHYLNWWTSFHAFVSYTGTWIILHGVNYKLAVGITRRWV